MKILFCSLVFYPDVGGIEITSESLARELSRLGNDVTLVTNTAAAGADNFPFRVVRRPGRKQLIALGKEAEVIFQNNIALQTLFPLFLARKPVVVTSATWVARSSGGMGWQDHLKGLALRLVENVAISDPIAKMLPKASTRIYNPFDIDLFYPHHDAPRTRDIVFVGRLVTDKGCDLALKALGILKAEGLTPTFTVIGDGTERKNLEALARDLGIADQVSFLGNLRETRAVEMGKHSIMVVPSVWAEPFGIVALEGIATGCAMIVSERGGLPEAVGKCGLLFPNGDVPALAAAIRTLLTDTQKREELISHGPEHLKQFEPAYVARQYMNLFEKLVRR